MTTTEIVLLGLLAAAAAAVIALLRRRGDEAGAAVRAEVARLADAAARQQDDDREVRAAVGQLRESLDRLQATARERARFEEPVWQAVRRLESVLVGGGSRGRPGENVLDEALSHLPPGMLARDFAVSGRPVEFALVLPDGRRLPVDSKWTAARELEALEAEQDPSRRQSLCRRIEDEVSRRAREVARYLDPALTTPFGVACVPDAAFAVCRRAHADAFGRGVVLAPYSTALAVLLALYSLAARHGDAGDVRACLADLDGVLEAMGHTLENKVARATAMLQNAADEWRTHLGRARGSVARGRGVAAAAPGDAGPPRPSGQNLALLNRSSAAR